MFYTECFICYNEGSKFKRIAKGKAYMVHKELEIRGAKAYTYFWENSKEMRPFEKRPVVVICPGGGYGFTSDREADPIAVRFMAMGYHAVVLRYSVAPERYPTQLLQLGTLVKYLKDHAKEYHIDAKKIFIAGFSAGGHLAASYGVFWDKEEPWNQIGATKSDLKPAGLILSYPVITSGEYAHHGSFQNLLGDCYEELKGQMSLENQVSKNTPPVFMWHTFTDNLVPVENSIMFFQALRKQNIATEMHIYPCGVHGLALADYETSNALGGGMQKECETWIPLVKTWLENMCK